MIVLAIESSSGVAGVAVLDNDKLVYEVYHHHKRNHSLILMPLVEEALTACETQLDKIDIFAVSSGPGSFTGLRIGISTVKGLAQAVEKPIAAIPTLDTLAYNIPPSEGVVCPILDARRDQVYTCIYKWNGDNYTKLSTYKAIPVTDLIELLLPYKQPIMFVGDGMTPYRDTLRERLGEYALFAPPHLSQQHASTTAWLGLKYAMEGKCIHYNELEPFYLRQSQAEQKKLYK